MSIVLKKCNFRYIKDNPKVHMIAKRVDATLSPYSVQMYSVPLTGLKGDCRNVHIGFLHKDHAHAIMEELKEENTYLIDDELSFWREYSTLTKTPLAIMMDGKCDIDEKSEIWEINYNMP